MKIYVSEKRPSDPKSHVRKIADIKQINLTKVLIKLVLL